jgi:hypothetical protein
MNFNEKETSTALRVFATRCSVRKVRIKDDFESLYLDYLDREGELYDMDKVKQFTSKYSGKDVYVYFDWAWFILEDDNFVIPEECFEYA